MSRALPGAKVAKVMEKPTILWGFKAVARDSEVAIQVKERRGRSLLKSYIASIFVGSSGSVVLIGGGWREQLVVAVACERLDRWNTFDLAGRRFDVQIAELARGN